MILFIISTLMAILLILFTILAISVGGAAFAIIFSDVIVCVIMIIWLMRYLLKKKKD